MGGGRKYDECGRYQTGDRTNHWGSAAADPTITSSMEPGDTYYNFTNDVLMVLNATKTAWVAVGGGSTSITTSRFHDDFEGTVLDPRWTVTLNGAGSVAMQVGAAAVVGGAVLLRDTGAAGANDAQVSLGTNRFIRKAQLSVYEVRFRATEAVALARLRFRVILHNAGAYNAVGDWLGVEYDRNTSVNIRIKSTIGGAAVQNVDSGIALVSGTWYTMRVKFMADGSAVVTIFSATGTVLFTTTITAANTTAVQLEPLGYVDDGGGALGNACDLELDYVDNTQNRV
jgi:hypothetical protein